jgi:UDP-N-acetylglucosamine 2-epimerase (non-hydrolysing)
VTIRILTFLGTRPEVIKLGQVLEKLEFDYRFSSHVISTGQHVELFAKAIDAFSFKIHDDLKLMVPGQSQNQFISRCIQSSDEKIRLLQPDAVIVHGDTNTSVAIAIAAFGLKVPVIHIESGLRSKDIFSPWPEEANRRLIDSISTIKFPPTKIALRNLEAEGLDKNSWVSGNTICDAITKVIPQALANGPALLEELGLTRNKFILVTQHRRESFDGGIDQVFKALVEIANSGIKIVVPLHPNPNVIQSSKKYLHENSNIILTDGLEYLSFLSLLQACKLVISDSGGIQEEAYILHKPLLITRNNTERPEVLQNKISHLVGYDIEEIVKLSKKYFSQSHKSDKLNFGVFGDGKSSEFIIEKIAAYFTTKSLE